MLRVVSGKSGCIRDELVDVFVSGKSVIFIFDLSNPLLRAKVGPYTQLGGALWFPPSVGWCCVSHCSLSCSPKLGTRRGETSRTHTIPVGGAKSRLTPQIASTNPSQTGSMRGDSRWLRPQGEQSWRMQHWKAPVVLTSSNHLTVPAAPPWLQKPITPTGAPTPNATHDTSSHGIFGTARVRKPNHTPQWSQRSQSWPDQPSHTQTSVPRKTTSPDT